LVDELLLHADSVVCSGGIDVPLETVLFRMVLGQEIGVISAFDCGNKLNTVCGLAGRDEFPKASEGRSVEEGLKGDCPTMMEPKQS
jgi:hypothetical protein